MTTNISTKSLLDYIAASATSRTEEDEAYLMMLMQPTTDRDEMGDLYSNRLGYNPIKYFDEKDLRRIYSAITRKAPMNIRTILETNEDLFIEKTMIRLDESREEYLTNLLAKVISEETGWIDPDLDFEETDTNGDSFDSLEDFEDGDDNLNEDDMSDDEEDDDEYDGSDGEE